MKKRGTFVCFVSICSILLITSCSTGEKDQGRINENFDFGWKFHRGDAPGADLSEFDASSWREVDLPHDWSIEDIPGTGSPFDSTAIGGRGTGFTVGGTGWYIKDFILDRSFAGKRVDLLFEGIYMDADIWVNDHFIDNHPYGYTSFHFDITEQLNFDGTPNRISVKVKNEGVNCRWYSGSGIYRHVWLTATDPVHIRRWGTFVSTEQVTGGVAEIRVSTEIRNTTGTERVLQVSRQIMDPSGNGVADLSEEVVVAPFSNTTLQQLISVEGPQLWSPETPFLYSMLTVLQDGERILDQEGTTFGIRTVVFDPERGMLLNGKETKLRGGCMHHDNGPLGSAAYDRAEERRVELMKANGFNAIRTSHNPPSPGFLDACDRLGMLVIDELFDGWFQNSPKKPYYHMAFEEGWQGDLENFVYRDRNHPSVIMWSTGNEIMDKTTLRAEKAQQELAGMFRRLDPSRAVTCGVNKWGHENWDTVKAVYMAPLDVVGYNYLVRMYAEDHNQYPERLIFASESFPKEAFQYWMPVLDHPYLIGDFVWTGFDYLGEVSIGWHGFSEGYPWTVAYCGDIDICGFKRPQSCFREIVWGTGKRVAMFVKNPVPTFGVASHSKWDFPDVHASWTWPGYEGTSMEVVVYSNGDRVVLALNGEEIGTGATGRANEFTAAFRVPFEPGSLVATAYEGEQEIDRFELVTAGEPAALRMTADRMTIEATGQDLSYLTVEVVDKEGNRIPSAEELVSFTVEGAGEIIGVGSARPNSVESFQNLKRTTFEGRCIAIVKSAMEPGEIRVRASAGGLEPALLVLNSE
jgi:beta-galactosidase